MAVKELSNELIIQNFRSWRGKNYFPFSRINFLFGGNSSGKSSIIAAISLLKQSYKSDQNNYCIEKLIGNGTSINLGQIKSQVHKDTPQFSEDWRDELLSFGARYRNQSSILKILNSTQGPFTPIRDVNFDYKIDALETCSFFSAITGSIQAVDLRLNKQLLVEILHKNLYKEKSFGFAFSKDETFLRSLINKKKHSFDVTEVILNPANSLISLLPRPISKQLTEVTKTFTSKINLLHEIEINLMHLKTLDEVLKEMQTKLHSYKDANPPKNVIKGLNEQIKKQEMEIVSKSHKIAELNHELYSSLNLSPPSKKPDLAEIKSSIAQKLSEELPFPASLLTRWSDADIAISDLTHAAEFEIHYGSNLFESIFGRAEPNFENLFQGYERSHLDIKNLDSEDANYRKMIAWSVFAALFTNFPDFISLLKNALFATSNLTAHCYQIGPSRELPSRVGVIDPYAEAKDIGKSGENLLNLLYNSDQDTVDLINNWMKKLELGYQISTSFAPEFNVQRFSLIDENQLEVAIHDVGYGVSQVLPVVMQLLLSKQNLITIEQPELHIHPRLQANLAELFIWSAENLENWLIVETHSEHIILRLQKLQREKSKDQRQFSLGDTTNILDEQSNFSIYSDINIHVIEKLSSRRRSLCSTLKITSNGEFDGEWPGGFFEERYIEKGLI